MNTTATLTPARHAAPRRPLEDRLSARLGVSSLAQASRPIERRLVAAGLPSSLAAAGVSGKMAA